jgi:hypothetical protein
MKTIRQLFEESRCFGEAGAGALFGDPEGDTLPTMTICIGALCDGGKSVILAADRQVTHQASGLSAPGPDCKIFDISSRLRLAAANDPPSRAFIDGLQRSAPSWQSVPDAANAVVDACTQLWWGRIEQAVLRPYAQTTYSGFLEAVAKQQLTQKIADDIWDMIKKIPKSGPFLMAGVDEREAHLYAIAEREGAFAMDSPGFAPIGSGASLVTPFFYQYGHQKIKSMELPRAIYTVYEAKKAAECLWTVGKDTDIVVISAGQDACPLGAAAIAKLDELYESKKPSPLSDAEAGVIRAVIPEFPAAKS